MSNPGRTAIRSQAKRRKQGCFESLRPLRCLLAGSGLFTGVLASGQDALTSALSLEPVFTAHQTAPVDLRPDRPHIGPVQLSLGLYAGTEANDNINASETNPESDLLLHGGMSLGFFWPATDQSQLQFSGTFGYVHYVRTSQNDHLEIAPDSALTWAVGFEDATLTLFDQISYSQSVSTESALSGVAVYPRLDNTIGARIDWLPNRWAFALGYSHNDFISNSSQFEYLNRSSEYFFGRAGWRFAEKTQAGLEASASITEYQLSIQPNNKNVSFGPYLEWQVTQALRATLRGGSVIYLFDTPQKSLQGSALDSFYFGLEMSQQLTDFLSHRLSVRRDVRQGVNQGSGYIEELTGEYAISWALTQRISVGGHFTYEHGKQPYDYPIYIFPFGQFIFETVENYDRYGGGPSISWQATDHISASLGYNYWLRQSNLAGLGYSQNSASLTVKYSF